MTRFRDMRAKKTVSLDKRQEDEICPQLFDIKISFFPQLGQAGVYFKNELICWLDCPIHDFNFKAIGHFLQRNHQLLKNNFDLGRAKEALHLHVIRVKTENIKCRFLSSENLIVCHSAISCPNWRWNDDKNLSRCDLHTFSCL